MGKHFIDPKSSEQGSYGPWNILEKKADPE
jgi:hypothetical protein